MIGLLREHRAFFFGTALAGLMLRLFFVLYCPAITDDSRIYADLATNWLQHGVYGESQSGQPDQPVLATDARLPGYPAFLAGVFWLFGAGNFTAALLAQAFLDLGTCFIIADLARRMVSERAARIAFVLAALCPFLANYSAAALTETLEIFFTALALDFAVACFDSAYVMSTIIKDAAPDHIQNYLTLAAATGIATGGCILLRPDGGILLAAILCGCFAKRFSRRSLVVGAVIAIFALAPLAPWTIRNFRTLHHFQPLAPRYANDTDELVPRGFNRWAKTWIVDYVSVQEVYWNVPGFKIDAQKFPSRAFDNSTQRDETEAIISDYNESQDITPELDSQFGELAAERIHARPLRYYFVLPVLRIGDMWLRPRTELLATDPRWWEFNDEVKHSCIAVGFGLLNLAYIALALVAVIRRRLHMRWAGLLIGFLLLRSAFLGTLENPEPRYTLEGYPAVIVLAASIMVRETKGSESS